MLGIVLSGTQHVNLLLCALLTSYIINVQGQHYSSIPTLHTRTSTHTSARQSAGVMEGLDEDKKPLLSHSQS